ncbi:Yip1 family protein [Paracoccus sp. (in: a-proteobacteria)]|uniref:Yip1 family protein n=1 Tax=Paracoccus sp. TaxID=267 RepID=UPI003A8B3FC6
MNFNDLKALFGLTLRDPQMAARVVIAADWPVPARWMAALIVAVASAGVAWVATLIFPLPDEALPPIFRLPSIPFAMAGTQILSVALVAGLMAGVGRMFGGKGRFEDALLLVVWIQVVLELVQAVQIVLTLILPPAGSLMTILSLVLSIWLMVKFSMELHGFTSGAKVLLALIGTLFVTAFVLSFIAAAFGLLPEIPQ